MTIEDSTASEVEDFTRGEGLRVLLNRLHSAGSGAWQHDPTAADLMGFAAEKYAPLARKHGLDPWEAASAAFDVMRTKAAREADNPWAVITHAVRITCIAAERAQGLLCSTHQARRPHVSAFHDPERFSDRHNPLADYHPALQVNLDTDHTTAPKTPRVRPRSRVRCRQRSRTRSRCSRCWGGPRRWHGPRLSTSALAKSGTRHTAYETLRRDKHARALLDLPGGS